MPEFACAGSDVRLTSHARRRAVERNIPDRLQQAVLTYADFRKFRPGGLKIAMITRRKLERLADQISIQDRERLQGVIVLYVPESQAIVTAFRDNDARAKQYRRN